MSNGVSAQPACCRVPFYRILPTAQKIGSPKRGNVCARKFLAHIFLMKLRMPPQATRDAKMICVIGGVMLEFPMSLGHGAIGSTTDSGSVD